MIHLNRVFFCKPSNFGVPPFIETLNGFATVVATWQLINLWSIPVATLRHSATVRCAMCVHQKRPRNQIPNKKLPDLSSAFSTCSKSISILGYYTNPAKREYENHGPNRHCCILFTQKPLLACCGHACCCPKIRQARFPTNSARC